MKWCLAEDSEPPIMITALLASFSLSLRLPPQSVTSSGIWDLDRLCTTGACRHRVRKRVSYGFGFWVNRFTLPIHCLSASLRYTAIAIMVSSTAVYSVDMLDRPEAFSLLSLYHLKIDTNRSKCRLLRQTSTSPFRSHSVNLTSDCLLAGRSWL